MTSKKLTDYKGCERGTCLVLGTAPSLDRVPREFIESYKKIGVNFSILHVTSDYHAIIDLSKPDMTNIVRKSISYNKIPCFVTPAWWKFGLPFQPFENEIVLNSYPDCLISECFSFLNRLYNNVELLETHVTSRVTVTLELAVPLAFYLGFDKVILAGVDLKASHAYCKAVNSVEGKGFHREHVVQLLEAIQNSDKINKIFTIDKYSELPFQKWSVTF